MIKQFMKKWKNLSKDFILNIIASFMLTAATQVVVYPMLAHKFSSEIYGEILTLMGIVSIAIVALGNSLDNVRLIVNSDYEKEQVQGDFNIIALIVSIISVIITGVASGVFFGQTPIEIILLCIYVGIMTFNTYACVEYRLLLNFKKILICNTVTAVGYILGVLLLEKIPVWPLPFACAMIIQLLYVLCTTKVYREKWSFTPLWKKTISKYSILIMTGLFSNMLIYMDRLLIYPLLGSDSVSTYSVAAFFGKSLGIVMIPVAGVLLGYFSQSGFQMSVRKFRQINGISLILGIGFMVLAVVLSPIITKLLYPDIYMDARSYLFMANLGATISVVCSLTQAAVLKFAPTRVQLIKEVAYCVTYVVTCLLLLEKYELWGFCIAALVANLVKLLILYVLGEVYLKEKRK